MKLTEAERECYTPEYCKFRDRLDSMNTPDLWQYLEDLIENLRQAGFRAGLKHGSSNNMSYSTPSCRTPKEASLEIKIREVIAELERRGKPSPA